MTGPKTSTQTNKFFLRLTADSYFSDVWKVLPDIPSAKCKYEASFHNQRIFIFASTSHYYDIATKSWVDIIPANLRTRVYPLIYNSYVYTFPKLDCSDNLDYDIFRAKKALLLCSRYDKKLRSIQNIPYSKEFLLGSSVVIVKKKFYTLQWQNKDEPVQLVGSFMEDLEQITFLCDTSHSGARLKKCHLVALPSYGDFKRGSGI